MWETIYDKLGDLIVALSLAGVFGAFRKSAALNKEIQDIKVKYATQDDLKAVEDMINLHAGDDRQVHRNLEDKLDHYNETVNTKIDTVINILLTKSK